MKYRFKTKPYKHQKRALTRFFKARHLAVLWEPGLGKSKFVVDAACAGYMMGKISRVLIVCPLSVIGVWEDEFEKHATVGYRLQAWSRDLPSPVVKTRKLNVLVVNYDLGWRRKKQMAAFEPDFVVADESHKIKNAATKRSRFLRGFNKAPYRAILTGTPNPRGFLDLYGQWVFVNPQRFGTRIADYKQRYILYGGYKGYQVIGYQNVDELKKKVAADATVVRSKDALDLPEERWQRIPVELEPYARRQYDKLAEDYFIYLEESGAFVEIKMALTKLGKLQQFTGGFVNTEDGWQQVSSAKLNALDDILEGVYESGDKCVVFARYRAEIDACHRLAKGLGLRTYTLTGSTPVERRSEYRRSFQRTTRPSVFIAQIATGGLGISLTGANQAVFYSTSFALDDYIQARKRIHRIGQDRPVLYRHLVCRNTVDLDIYAAMKNKQQVMDVIMKNRDLTGKNRHDIV